MPRLADRVAIVTGASSGIGRAAALRLAAEGAALVLGARRRARLDKAVAEIRGAGGRAVALAGDVMQESYAQALVQTGLDAFGRLDIAFNNAGSLGAVGPTDTLSLAQWRATLDTNLSSAFLAAKYQAPAMAANGGGSLIFTSSFVGHTVAFPEVAAYAASKAGLIGLVKALAVEYAAQDIRVNALLPGATDTPMATEFASSPEAQDFVKGLYPLHRFASPAEMAESVLYLASDASSFTTGTALLVDGGISVARA